MDNSLALFICLQVLMYFILKKKKYTERTCFICLEELQDEVETICGHRICFPCLDSETCKCGYKVSLLFSNSLNKEVALFNITHSHRTLAQIFQDWIPLTQKLLEHTLSLNGSQILKPWACSLGLIYFLSYLHINNTLSLQIFCLPLASFFSSLIFHSNQVQSSCLYFTNPLY